MGDGSIEMNPKEVSIAAKLRAHLPFESHT
jgi:hypothetical protein